MVLGRAWFVGNQNLDNDFDEPQHRAQDYELLRHPAQHLMRRRQNNCQRRHLPIEYS